MAAVESSSVTGASIPEPWRLRFTGDNTHLGNFRPVDVWDSEPDHVVSAAEALSAELGDIVGSATNTAAR
jgi:hypothetical protein